MKIPFKHGILKQKFLGKCENIFCEPIMLKIRSSSAVFSKVEVRLKFGVEVPSMLAFLHFKVAGTAV